MIKKMLLISLISIAFQLLTNAQNNNSKLNLTTIFKTSTLKPEVISNYYFMNDGENYAMKSHDSLNIYSLISGKLKGTILLFSKFLTENGSRPIQADDYYFSSNEIMLLIKTETEKIYRRSTKAYYYIYFINSGRFLPLSTQGKQRLV